MSSLDKAAEIIDSLHTADQILIEGSVGYFDAPAAALELAIAGLLVPDVQIIRTMEDLKALDPDTALTLYTWEGATIWKASYFQERFEDTGYIPALPAVVIATGEQVRYSREALEGEK